MADVPMENDTSPLSASTLQSQIIQTRHDTQKSTTPSSYTELLSEYHINVAKPQYRFIRNITPGSVSCIATYGAHKSTGRGATLIEARDNAACAMMHILGIVEPTGPRVQIMQRQ